jgi:hypothetical protein
LIGNTGRPVARRQATNRPWLVSIATGIGASGSSPASTSSCSSAANPAASSPIRRVASKVPSWSTSAMS